MAIYSSSISDDTINALLQSPDANMRELGQQYKDAKEQQDKELGRDKGIMGAISNIFGFGSAQGAEPEMPSSQKFSNQFSVTRPSQFDFKPEPIIPGNVMADSVMKDVVDTPTREFGTIRAGQPELGIKGAPAVQDLPVDFSELDDLEAQDAAAQQLIAQAQQEERRGALDTLKAFGKDVAGRTLASQFLSAAGAAIDPTLGLAGGLAGFLKGGNMFEPSQSQLAFNALTPSQQRAVGSIYGQGGIMQGYNPVSAFGRGPRGAIENRISNILGREAAQTAASRAKVRELQQALTDIGGDSGGSGDSYDGASSMEEYSADPTGFSGSF